MNISNIILRDKRDTDQEYTVQLFEKCNLTCGFCWQDHNAETGMNTIQEKIPILQKALIKDAHNSFSINIMGGELFSDDFFSEKVWNDYFNLCVETNKTLLAHNKTAKFNFVTNLVNNNPDSIKQLIDKLRAVGVKTFLTTSYDAKGRFNKMEFDLFKQNVETLREYIACVSMLLTKPTIKHILNDDDYYFKYLYNNFYIYFDYYSPTNEFLTVAPSDKDLLDVFSFLIDNYPNSHPIKEWMSGRKNFISCRSSRLILPDGTECMCGNLSIDNPIIMPFFRSKIYRNNNDEIEENFLQERNCLACEYFDRCTMGCFVQHDFMKRGQKLDECVFKLTFDKIIKKEKVETNI